jgi:hypothetical protein
MGFRSYDRWLCISEWCFRLFNRKTNIRTVPQKPSSRRGVSQQETYRYAPSLKVSAREVNTYTEPVPDSKTTNLIKALQSGQSILESFGKYKAGKSHFDYKEGQEKALAGKQLTEAEAQVDAKVKGFQEVMGRGDAYKFDLLVQKYFSENKYTSPEDFQEGLKLLEQGFTEGKSEHYLRGFVPEAMKTEHAAFSNFTKVKQLEVQEKHLENITNDFKNTLAQTQGNPEILRKKLTQLQEESKALGIDRLTVSERILDAVGLEAERTGNPDLLSFADLKENGIALTDTALAKTVQSYRDKAETAKSLYRKAQEGQIKELRKEAKQVLVNEFLISLSDMKAGQSSVSPEKVIGLRQQIVNFSDARKNELGIALDNSDVDRLLTLTENLLETEGFSNSSDVEVLRSLTGMSLAITGEEDMANVLDYLEYHRSNLTKEDYLKYTREIMASAKLATNAELKAFKELYKRNTPKFLSSLAQYGDSIAEQELLGLQAQKAKNQDSRRQSYAQVMLDYYITEALQENGGKPLSPKEYFQIQETVRKEAKEVYPEFDPMDFGDAEKPQNKTTETSLINRLERLKRLGRN